MRKLPLLLLTILLINACSTPQESKSNTEGILSVRFPEPATFIAEPEWLHCDGSTSNVGDSSTFTVDSEEITNTTTGWDCFKVTGDMDIFISNMSEILRTAEYTLSSVSTGTNSDTGIKSYDGETWYAGKIQVQFLYYVDNEVLVITTKSTKDWG